MAFDRHFLHAFLAIRIPLPSVKPTMMNDRAMPRPLLAGNTRGMIYKETYTTRPVLFSSASL